MVKIRRITGLIISLLLAAFVQSFAEGGLVFSITEWDTGTLESGIVSEQTVEVANNTPEAVIMDLISTCSCMTTEPDSLTVEPGDTGSFAILFDSSDDQGAFEKLLIIQTDSDAMPKGFFVVTGSVLGGTAAAADEAGGTPIEASSADEQKLFYYYTPGCKSCNRFLKNSELPIDKRDITEAEYFEELQNLLDEHGTVLKEVPVLVIDDNIFQGEEAVIAAYTAALEGRIYTDSDDVGDAAESSAAGSLSILAVLAAGLLDGVNPCAFTTLIFLLSALSVAGRSRRETLVIGLFFTATVFVTYYLIGLGFFKIIRIADSFELVSRIIRWLLFGVLILFSGLSFYDYTKIRAGKATEILLQLPAGVKRRMHSSIRSTAKSAALAGSSIVMGFLISIFELGCTGQIYFPTITYIIQTNETTGGYLYLALYNISFILPLAVVFIVAYFGMTSKKITRLFQTKLGLIKILTGLLFLGFAALMLWY